MSHHRWDQQKEGGWLLVRRQKCALGSRPNWEFGEDGEHGESDAAMRVSLTVIQGKRGRNSRDQHEAEGRHEEQYGGTYSMSLSCWTDSLYWDLSIGMGGVV